jgi:clan AA aspartic protease
MKRRRAAAWAATTWIDVGVALDGKKKQRPVKKIRPAKKPGHVPGFFCYNVQSNEVDTVGIIHVTVTLRALLKSRKKFEADFLVDTGATDSLAPASRLKKAGIKPVGKMTYETADGRITEMAFGLAVIEFMGEITSGRVIFGPDAAEPLLGVTALESVGILVDPSNQRLKRLPAIPLK